MCLKFFGILILDLRWICQLRFIAVFVRSWPCVLVPLLNCLKSLIWLLKYSLMIDLFLIMRWTFDNMKHLTIYTQEERKFYFPYRVWLLMCYVGLTCPQDHCLFDRTLCCFFILPLFPYTLFRKYQFLKELLWKYFLA